MLDLNSIFAIIFGVTIIGFFVFELIETNKEVKELEKKQ